MAKRRRLDIRSASPNDFRAWARTGLRSRSRSDPHLLWDKVLPRDAEIAHASYRQGDAIFRGFRQGKERPLRSRESHLRSTRRLVRGRLARLREAEEHASERIHTILSTHPVNNFITPTSMAKNIPILVALHQQRAEYFTAVLRRQVLIRSLLEEFHLEKSPWGLVTLQDVRETEKKVAFHQSMAKKLPRAIEEVTEYEKNEEAFFRSQKEYERALENEGVYSKPSTAQRTSRAKAKWRQRKLRAQMKMAQSNVNRFTQELKLARQYDLFFNDRVLERILEDVGWARKYYNGIRRHIES